MSGIAQPNLASQPDTRKLLSKYFRSFLGVFTQAKRTAIPDDYFYNLENVIPIGDQNAQVVPNISASLFDYATDSIYASFGVNLNGTEYLVNLAANGKVFFYNIVSKTSSQVNSGTLLSGSASQVTQWNNSQILFIDSTGYYHYDGTTFAAITGSGVPSSGQAIAVYQGRVWIAQGRILYCSGVGDYSAASWTAANGASSVNLVDPQIRSSVTRLISANDYLYIFSNSSIFAISNVYVPSGASPPTPVFTLSNLQALIGTDQPLSITPYDRNILFASRYGTHTLIGVDAPKMSSDIDGTWQYLDFSQQISAGQVVVENILCGAFLLKRLNDPNFGSNQIVALWFNKSQTNQLGAETSTDIWWFANFGALTLIVTGFVNNIPALFGFIGNKLYQLFGDTTTAPAVSIWTKLYPMEDELSRKQAIQVGFEADFSLYGSALNLYVDTASESANANLQTNVSSGLWVNASGTQGQWVNGSSQSGGWVAPGLYLLSGLAPAMMDRHIGLRLTSTGYNFALHLMAMDYKLHDRWMPG
jgi:hypothetical protein